MTLGSIGLGLAIPDSENAAADAVGEGDHGWVVAAAALEALGASGMVVAAWWRALGRGHVPQRHRPGAAAR